MKDFLKKYLTEEQLVDLEKKYLAEHPEEKGLPMHISKGRLDEVLGKKKAAEEAQSAAEKALKELQEKTASDIQAAVKAAQDAAEADKQAAIKTLQQDFAATEAIYKARGRNVKAIKALIDPTKKIEDEIARIRKSDSYLFDDDIPDGTGKNGSGGGNQVADKELAAMRSAVGI
jgi:cell pole-organizing protein PopZ